MPDSPFTQNQAQQQQLTVNFQNSSDPNLELRILNQVHSAGRQLGRISAVVDVLLAAVADNAELATEAGSAAVADFRKMLAEIAEQKRAHSTEYFIAQLEALKRDDLAAYEKTAARLRAFLDPPSRSASP
jgi:hypothetical protein